MPRVRSTRALTLVVLALGTVAVVAARQAVPTPQNVPVPVGDPAALGLAGYTKVLCSAVFVSGRDPEEASRNSAYWWLQGTDLAEVKYEVDRDRRVVRATHGAFTKEARHYGDQGCVLPADGRIHFTPTPVRSTLPGAQTMPWPMGDAPDNRPLPDGIDKAKLDAAVEAAFDPAAMTAAFIVVYKGQIVAERYMEGVTRDTQLESWSMGKSLTATLFALLVKDGTYTLDQPAPVPLWQTPGDARQKISVRHLMNMSSGLRFVGNQDPAGSRTQDYPDHYYIYTGAIDVFEYSITRPLEFEPGTEGRYRNSDPLTIGYLIRREVERRGENYLTWPQQALFDRIGIRRQVLEPDPYGNFLLTGYDYGTARNWARIGLLHLQDGMWMGERLLPEGWTTFVSARAPGWRRPEYGGLFWLNGIRTWTLPEDTYLAAGAGGQNTYIVPSRDLVIVRMGHFRGSGAGRRANNRAFTLLLEALPLPSPRDYQRPALFRSPQHGDR
ncbi:MAG TPA: serine hydrolase [Vicinamibacterales bacterium]|nr:serine hydrolase [Vicinamibacterales bacterium]